jgi:hypothetical protein
VVLLIATIVAPDVDRDNKNSELAQIAAHKGSYLLSGLLFLLATTLLLFAGFGLVRMFRGSRGVTLGQVAGVLLSLGAMVGAGWYAFGVAEYEMVNQSGVDRGALATFLDKADETSTVIPLVVMFLVGVVIGVLLLGIASIRTRVVPVWAGAAMIVAAPLTFLSDGKGMQIVANAILLIGLGSLGLRALQMSDEEWDAPRERAAKAPAPEATTAPAPAA